MNADIIRTRASKFIIPALVVALLIVAGLVIYDRSNGRKEIQTDQPVLHMVSASELEEQYGLRVNLIAVTGAGSFVDVRIKIVDGEKAKLLLSDDANFPAVLADNDIFLLASVDTRSQPIIFDDNADMFILYSNASNTVKPGAQVRILFGEIALEPVTVLQ